MSNRIEHIVIVGGGTAGWLSAVCLNRILSRTSGPPCRVTLIESSDIGTIGVGEATVVSIKNTFRLCDLDEADWMIQCNASFKMAIKFVGWSGIENNEVYWHTFGPLPSLRGLPLSHFWLKRRLRGRPEPFAKSCFSAVTVCEARRAPKAGDESPYEGKEEYAYHVDAGLLADYLKRIGKSRGVRQVVDNVLEVVLDERGYVSHLRTAKNGELYGDLFIDCSGFRGLLINEALEEPFVPFSDSLLCDSAIAMPIPTDDERHGINPYTTATALSSGWVWHTPLFGRSGNGYVYSSACVAKGKAEVELRQHLGPPSEGIEARHIRMRVGRTRNPWVKNCVSVGLAGGFIEPLESTGIWFIELALYNLVVNFPDKTFNLSLIEKFNGIMRKYYEQVRDFIVLHYRLTNREDTAFWRANQHDTAMSDTLKANLELWAAMLPGHEKLDDPGFFKDYSYASILTGLGRVPERSWPLLDHRDEEEAEPLFDGIRSKAEAFTRSLPDHYEYLAGLRRGCAGGSRGPSVTETIHVQSARE